MQAADGVGAIGATAIAATERTPVRTGTLALYVPRLSILIGRLRSRWC